MEEKMHLPRAVEQYGTKSILRRYTCDRKGVRRLYSKGENNLWNNGTKFIKEAFLPQGYPESVSSDYLSYQIWDTAQAFCSSITSTLATMAVLKGVGVGDSSATALAATITWMLRDGTGMLGRILFAWLHGSDLDCNSKRWRLVADIMNDVGTFLELLTALFPFFFSLIVCLASVSKAIVGTAGSATRAAFVQHQARKDNMADVAAKDGSQETLVNLAALLVNFFVTPAVAGQTELIWMLFLTFTGLHLWANYKAVSVVCMERLNKARLHIVMKHYFSTGSVLSVPSANQQEPLLTIRTGGLLSYRLGTSLPKVLTNLTDYEAAVKRHKEGVRFILKYHSNQKVDVALAHNSTPSDQLKAALVVELLDFILETKNIATNPVLAHHSQTIEANRGNGDLLLEFSEKFVNNSYPQLVKDLENAGWVTSHLLLGAGEWRYNWDNSDLDKRIL